MSETSLNMSLNMPDFGSLLIRLNTSYYLVIATSETRTPNSRVRFADAGDHQKGVLNAEIVFEAAGYSREA
jgi:hypothetical protein